MNRHILDYIKAQTEGLPPDWDIYRLSATPSEVPDGWIKVNGAVAPFMRRKPDCRNWEKMDYTTDYMFWVEISKLDEWLDSRGAAFNLCPKCDGEGIVVTGWSKDTGIKQKVCPRCNGTGKYETAP